MKRVPSSNNILVIGGHDPSGGAGIQADIETVSALGAHACSLITCHTVQNSQSMNNQYPSSATIFREQANALLQDIEFSAIKIGAISSIGILKEIIQILESLNEIPIVVDPVIAASYGSEFGEPTLFKEIFNSLLPMTSLITPNLSELNQLTALSKNDDAIQTILNTGCKGLLLTNTDSHKDKKIEHIYHSSDTQHIFECQRLEGEFHGSGCTLSTAIATYLSIETDIPKAISMAIDYTVNSIQHAKRPGKGQAIPKRIL